NSFLGGTITSSLVVPAMKTSENQINTDFFNELVSELTILGGQATYQENKGWFNPELTKIALDRLMGKANVDVLFNTNISRINIENNKIVGIYINPEILSVCIGAKYIVDATGNCEIGKIANCEFLNTEEEKQPVSLRFEMSGIDLKTFAKWIMDFDKDRNVTTCEIINGQIHLSTACTDSGNWALRPLFEDAISNNLLKEEDCKYFQVFTIPNKFDSLAFNCPRLYFEPEINALDPVKTSEALIKGRESILRIANFCKLYLPGFEKAYISTIANSLGVRVSRRIKGKYIYTENDLKTGKKFKNPVLVGNYPIDVHSNKKENSVLEFTNQDYEVPIEALMSADIDNLFVAGRCLSADFKAQAALRIQPACFSMGEGIAKHISTLL
ncbi:MAG: FAD-dependent oxidoreductase, partial [bacterium]|nr:FAD-dependent oxidoreductase [bacterium]